MGTTFAPNTVIFSVLLVDLFCYDAGRQSGHLKYEFYVSKVTFYLMDNRRSCTAD